MKLLRYFIDFLFPKSPIVQKLELMTSNEVISLLGSHPETSVPPLPDITSLFPYRDDTVHELIHEIKYAANTQLAEKIAPALIQSCPQNSIITFIPPTQSRKEKRGFDQGSIILSEMKKFNQSSSFTFERNLLSWNRKVLQQSLTSSKGERTKNMENALVCNSPELTKQKIVVVIDDVCTTGATLYEARRALLETGAERVSLLTIAH